MIVFALCDAPSKVAQEVHSVLVDGSHCFGHGTIIIKKNNSSRAQSHRHQIMKMKNINSCDDVLLLELSKCVLKGDSIPLQESHGHTLLEQICCFLIVSVTTVHNAPAHLLSQRDIATCRWSQ